MAKTIGSLNVSMGLSITDFIANLDKVKEDMSPEAMQTKQETLQNLDQQIQILKNRITGRRKCF